jgi:hypothetical protein
MFTVESYIMASVVEDPVCAICLDGYGHSSQGAPAFVDHVGDLEDTDTHIFHDQCIGSWIKRCVDHNREATCPLDRKEISKINGAEVPQPLAIPAAAVAAAARMLHQGVQVLDAVRNDHLDRLRELLQQDIGEDLRGRAVVMLSLKNHPGPLQMSMMEELLRSSIPDIDRESAIVNLARGGSLDMMRALLREPVDDFPLHIALAIARYYHQDALVEELQQHL